MKIQKQLSSMALSLICTCASTYGVNAWSNENSWSVVPYVGVSSLGDQSARVTGSANIADGDFSLDIGSGFTAGISVRYEYSDTPWISEFGWEYRSNDSTATDSNGELFNDGNYASNTFYVNGRYAFFKPRRLTPWLGGGLNWVQEIDLDSNSNTSANSFSDSGSIGVQLMAGLDFDLNDRIYLTSEIRYTALTDLTLNGEVSTGQVSGLSYEPLTFGIGLGIRF